MKNIKQLTEERAVLITELEGFEARLEALTAEEETRVNDITVELETLSKDLEAAKRREDAKRTIAIHTNPIKDTTEGVKGAFSYTRAIAGALNGNLDGLEKEMHQEGEKELTRMGKSSMGNLVVPNMILQKRAAVSENSTAGVDVISFEQALQARSVARELGVQFINLVSDGKVVIQNPTTVTWEGETDAYADGGQALTTASITPKRLASYVLLSKQLINQHNISVENAFIADIAGAVAAKLDYSFFNDDGFTEHAGNGVTAKANASVSSLMGAMVEQLMMSNADRGTLAFAASAGLFAEIAAATQVSSVTPLLSGNAAYGYPVRFTSQINDNGSAQELIYFANWSDFVIGQWGGLDILVDPYTAAGTGQVRLVLNSFFDGNQKRTSSFAVGAFTGTDIS